MMCLNWSFSGKWKVTDASHSPPNVDLHFHIYGQKSRDKILQLCAGIYIQEHEWIDYVLCVFHDLPQDSFFIPVCHVMFSEITKSPTVCMLQTASDCFQVIAL